MRFLVIVKGSPESEHGGMPTTEELAEMNAYNEQLVKAGIMLAGEGLQPSAKGKRVRFSGGEPTVMDGPFAEAKELVAGYWEWQARDMNEAIDWLKRAPFKAGEVEIRQIAEAEDLGEAYTPELRQQDERIRAEAARQR